jgi:hypothetical protein
VVVKVLIARKETLAVAESCTGGLLANRITNVPGASEVFVAGYICYANRAKIDMLDIDPKLIEKHGAVSGRIARALAKQARAHARSTYALANNRDCWTGRRFAGKNQLERFTWRLPRQTRSWRRNSSSRPIARHLSS